LLVVSDRERVFEAVDLIDQSMHVARGVQLHPLLAIIVCVLLVVHLAVLTEVGFELVAIILQRNLELLACEDCTRVLTVVSCLSALSRSVDPEDI
jgi:hypothetical protein